MPVYKDEKRGTWYVRFKQKDWTGQTRAIWKRGFSSKREAVQWELDYKIRQKGSLNMTFAQFVDVYKQDRINRINPDWADLRRCLLVCLCRYLL